MRAFPGIQRVPSHNSIWRYAINKLAARLSLVAGRPTMLPKKMTCSQRCFWSSAASHQIYYKPHRSHFEWFPVSLRLQNISTKILSNNKSVRNASGTSSIQCCAANHKDSLSGLLV